MATPTIAALPTAPARSMASDVFITTADAFLAALANFVTQANALAADVNNTNIAQSASALAQATSAATSAASALAQAVAAAVSATAAAASAEKARAIVGIPPAYASLIMQPNRIDTDMTIPDGQNAVIFGDFEIGPDVTVTGLGNANFVGIG